MKTKQTPGERIARGHIGDVFDTDGPCIALAADIDRAIRKAQAEAWESGWSHGASYPEAEAVHYTKNPYRGRTRK